MLKTIIIKIAKLYRELNLRFPPFQALYTRHLCITHTNLSVGIITVSILQATKPRQGLGPSFHSC